MVLLVHCCFFKRKQFPLFFKRRLKTGFTSAQADHPNTVPRSRSFEAAIFGLKQLSHSPTLHDPANLALAFLLEKSQEGSTPLHEWHAKKQKFSGMVREISSDSHLVRFQSSQAKPAQRKKEIHQA